MPGSGIGSGSIIMGGVGSEPEEPQAVKVANRGSIQAKINFRFIESPFG